MPKNAVSEWSATANNNTDVGGVNIAEGCPASGVNNALRTIMAQVSTFYSETLPTYADRAALAAATVPASVKNVRLEAYDATVDPSLGGAIYKRVVSEPSHALKVQSADGAWWEVNEPIVTPEMAGAIGDGAANDTVAVQSVLDTGFLAVGLPNYYACELLTFSTFGQKIFSNRGPALERGGTISALSSAVTTLGVIAEGGIMFENVTIEGPGRSVAGSVLIKCLRPDGGSGRLADIDVYFENCTLASAETLVHIFGRGFYATNNNFVDYVSAIKFDWPSPFLAGVNPNQNAVTGMRAYRIEDNRFHAGQAGRIMTNTGANKANITGIHFVGNYVDTMARLFDGELHDSLIAANTMIHNNVTQAVLINITAGSSFGITGNLFYGMDDNGAGVTYSVIGIATLVGVVDALISGNIIKRVARDVFTIGAGSSNISINDNVMTDVCLENTGATVRYPLRLIAAVDGVSFCNNTIRTPSMTLNTSIVGVVSGNPTNFDFSGNLFDTTEFLLTNATRAQMQGRARTDKFVSRYQGDGAASQTITLPFTPFVAMVSCHDGTPVGKTWAVSCFSAGGSATVEQSGASIIVKGDANVNLASYTVWAMS